MDYREREFTITGVPDRFCQWLVEQGIARPISPQLCVSRDEIDTQVDLDHEGLKGCLKDAFGNRPS